MKTALKILHLEDDKNDAELIVPMISMKGLAADIVRVETEQDYLSAVDQRCFDMICADYNLPSYDGMFVRHAALGVDAALNEISGNKNVLNDSAVVGACLRLFSKRDYKIVN